MHVAPLIVDTKQRWTARSYSQKNFIQGNQRLLAEISFRPFFAVQKSSHSSLVHWKLKFFVNNAFETKKKAPIPQRSRVEPSFPSQPLRKCTTLLTIFFQNYSKSNPAYSFENVLFFSTAVAWRSVGEWFSILLTGEKSGCGKAIYASTTTSLLEDMGLLVRTGLGKQIGCFSEKQIGFQSCFFSKK